MEGLKPLTGNDEVMNMINGWLDQVKEKIKKKKEGSAQEGFGLMDASTCANKRDSWKTVPQKVLSLAQKLMYQSLGQHE